MSMLRAIDIEQNDLLMRVEADWKYAEFAVTQADRELCKKIACEHFHATSDELIRVVEQKCQRDRAVMPLTDFGNAQRLVSRYGSLVCYCHPWRCWLIWDGKRWATDDTARIVRFAKDTVRGMYGEAETLDESPSRRALAEHARRSEAEKRISAIVKLAKSEKGIPVTPDQLDADSWLLNVNNGTINLRTGELRPHRAGNLITMLAPVAYNPNALAPEFNRFLDCIFAGDRDLIVHIQRYHGYALTGETSVQVLPIHYGAGANGKSTLHELILHVMGDYADTAPPDLLMQRRNDEHPTEIAGLMGKRLVVASESTKRRRLNVERVKRLTGDETLKARFMRGDFFSFKRKFKVILVTNNPPHVDEDTEATRRRLRLVPFAVTIPPDKRDPNLLSTLKREASGILAWLVRGCLDWQRHGLTEPAAVVDATKAFQIESDPLRDFIAECCEIAPAAWTSNRQLRQAYEAFCSEQGDNPISGVDFRESLKRHGCTAGRRHAGRGWAGIGLLSNRAELTA